VRLTDNVAGRGGGALLAMVRTPKPLLILEELEC